LLNDDCLSPRFKTKRLRGPPILFNKDHHDLATKPHHYFAAPFLYAFYAVHDLGQSAGSQASLFAHQVIKETPQFPTILLLLFVALVSIGLAGIVKYRTRLRLLVHCIVPSSPEEKFIHLNHTSYYPGPISVRNAQVYSSFLPHTFTASKGMLPSFIAEIASPSPLSYAPIPPLEFEGFCNEDIV
jgi:hypothetical protein